MAGAAHPLGERIERWAEEKPDALAVEYQGETLSWSQLRARIHRLSGALRAAGIARGDRVGFLDRNHPACLEVVFAAAALGAATSIYNWRLSGDELDHVINDSGARLLVVGEELTPVVDALRPSIPGVRKVLVLGGKEDTYEDFLAEGEPLGPRPEPETGPDDVCLVMYSSGTTGRPKGVMLSHRNLLAHTENVSAVLPFAEGDSNLVAMPLFHVGGTCYALLGIHAGVASRMLRNPDGPSLLGGFAAGATHAFFVPPVIAGLLDAGEPAVSALARAKYLVYGAAPMPLPLLQRALSAWPQLGFLQVYGQTELSGVITTLGPEEHRDPGHPERLLSAGRPLPGAELRVVDPATLRDAGEGEPGELWFRTEQVMLGFLGLPEATAHTLTPEGWLRTGDIGRVDAEGYVYIQDRLNDLIITGGENVYSPEVERVLQEHPSVAEAAVVGVPDERWGESVKAVVALRPGVDAASAAAELIAYTRTRLAHYKCPSTIDLVDALPRNPGGKILKRSLRAPYWEGRDRQV